MRFHTAVLCITSILPICGCAANAIDDDIGSVSQALSPVTLYRAYAPSNGDHLFTTNFNEAYYSPGYNYEGGKGSCMPGNDGTGLTHPMYRLYKPSTGDHFYTINWDERNNAMTYGGYVQEGTTCWTYVHQPSGGCWMWRWYHWGIGKHLIDSYSSEAYGAGYTWDNADVGGLGNCGGN
jgi:hypothetical protein